MKNWVGLGLVVLLTQTMPVSATESYYHRYGYPTNNPQIASESYPVTTRTVDAPYAPASVTTTQPVMPQQYTQTPRAPQYGFYAQSSRFNGNQRYITGGNPYVATSQTSAYSNQNSYYNSPVFTEETRTRAKLYYLGVHGGIGGTFGWDHGEKNPIKPVLGLIAGTWATPNIRLDAEFDYHVKGNIGKGSQSTKTYKQYDLGANAYYDFPITKYGFQPFIGGGLWLVKKMVTAHEGASGKSHSGWKLALSAAAGLAYPINENWRLTSMLRARYIVTNEGLYNLEALIGATYSF